MPDDFDLDTALDRLDAGTRTLVRVRPAEDIRVQGARRHRARVGALSAAAAVVVVAVVAGYLSSGTSAHRSAPPASTTSPTPTAEAALRSVADSVLLGQGVLPALQGGSWTAGTTRDEAPITDPPHSCASSTLTALGAVEARQRDWSYVTPGDSGTHLREVVGAYTSVATADTAERALLTAFDGCEPKGLQHPRVSPLDGVASSPTNGRAASADVFEVSGATSDSDGRFEYVVVGRRANAVVVLVLSHGGQDSNLEPSVWNEPAVAALDRLAPYDAPAAPAG